MISPIEIIAAQRMKEAGTKADEYTSNHPSSKRWTLLHPTEQPGKEKRNEVKIREGQGQDHHSPEAEFGPLRPFHASGANELIVAHSCLPACCCLAVLPFRPPGLYSHIHRLKHLRNANPVKTSRKMKKRLTAASCATISSPPFLCWFVENARVMPKSRQGLCFLTLCNCVTFLLTGKEAPFQKREKSSNGSCERRVNCEKMRKN